MIRYTTGNLLQANVQALVNTVNTQGLMGKGIALQFKKQFTDNFNEYAEACKQNNVKIGKVFITEVPQALHTKVQYIINFPTKDSWRAKSRVEYIQTGLRDLTEQITRLNIRSIALPPLGCGLGGLQWSQIKPLIENAFQDMPQVEVLVFEPGHTPPAREMKNNSPKPQLTGLWAAFLKLVYLYVARSISVEISQVELQKLAYFLCQTSLPWKLNFSKGKYGPYSQDLCRFISDSDGHYVSGFGDGTQPVLTPNIKLVANMQEVDTILEKTPNLKKAYIKALSYIEGFEEAYSLELLGSVHWAAKHEVKNYDLSSTIEFVQHWTTRKKTLFTTAHIKLAYEHLQEVRLIPA